MSLTIEFIQGCLVVSCRCGERLVHWHSLFSNSDGSFPAIPGIEHLAPAVLSECQKCHANVMVTRGTIKEGDSAAGGKKGWSSISKKAAKVEIGPEHPMGNRQWHSHCQGTDSEEARVPPLLRLEWTQRVQRRIRFRREANSERMGPLSTTHFSKWPQSAK